MVDAADAAVFQPAITQIGAPMGTITVDQSGPALIVTKQNQIFAHQPYRHRRSSRRQLVSKGGWLPVAAQQFAAWLVWTGLGEQIVFFLADHSFIP